MTVKLDLLDSSINKLVSAKNKPHIKQHGGSLGTCIVIVMSILIVSLSVYFTSIYAEKAHYDMHCADYEDIINPKEAKSFLVSAYKIYKMSVNRYQLEQCKALNKKRSEAIYNFVESTHSLTKDLSSVIKTTGGIIIFLITLFTQGLKGLICLATKYMNLEVLCGIDCKDFGTKPKPAETKKK